MGAKSKPIAPALLAQQPVRHDGKDYAVGETLPEMDAATAQQLIESGVAMPEHPFPQIDNAP